MLHPRELRREIIRPALERIELYSPAAANLLLATVLVESIAGGWQHLVQQGGGPALGVYQIEPATHGDIWRHFLRYRETLRERVASLAIARGVANVPPDEELKGNLFYATAIARLVYYRDPQPLPPADDLEALGRTWKRVYNTRAGAGTVEHFLDQVEPYRGFFTSAD